MNLINELQSQFFREAKNSPILLSDLASMETYIAESYQDRSIIELLQNADDALSSRFLIKKVSNTIIVANDGREFSEEDIIAICRSGSSTKKRGGSIIGYRGIGFKSVVNLADRVHIIGKNVRLTFSRELTNKLFNEKIQSPLIRIPHNYTPLKDYEAIISELVEQNYTTIFIFEQLKRDNLENEIEYFDSSSLLFLKKIKQLEFDTNIDKLISVKRKINEEQEFLTITEDGAKENWLVCRGRSNKIEAIAFLLNENLKLVEVDPLRSVAHSFMPTKDNVGLPIKVNGDFSTDPSRTKIVFDEATFNSIEICCNLILETIKRHFNNEELLGLFHILSDKNENVYSKFSLGQKFKEHFINKFKDTLNTNRWFIGDDGDSYSIKDLKVNPMWLNQHDFLSLTEKSPYYPIQKDFESRFPGLLKFIEGYGAKQLTIDEILEVTNNSCPTINGAVEIFLESIKKYRFQLNEKVKGVLKNAHILYFEEIGCQSISQLVGSEKIDSTYLEQLKFKLNDMNDLEYFMKNLEIPMNTYINEKTNGILEINKDNGMIPKENDSINSTNKFEEKISGGQNLKRDIIKYSNSVKKWRSVEINLAAFLEMEEDVEKVIDVSKSNLGYDLEVYRGSNIEYVEIKSVESIGATISMTNNEYSTANELKKRYVLAIAKQTQEGIEVCFIKDPLNQLNLTKRVTRWEWICDEYSGVIINFDF
jgi:hypothetical protein